MAIQEWWSDLPTNLRLCDDLYEVDITDALENNKSAPKAIIFSFIRSILFKIYGCVLDIKCRSTGSEGRDSESISHDKKSSLYHRATLRAAERCCEQLLSIIIRMFTLQQDMLPCKLITLVQIKYHIYIYGLMNGCECSLTVIVLL